MMLKTNNARSAILSRLRQGQHKVKAAIPFKARHFEADSIKALFIDKLHESHAETYESDEENWSDIITQIAQENSFKTWLVAKHLPLIEQACKTLKSSQNDLSFVHYDKDYEALKEHLFKQVDVSITLAKAAIAETGTLLLIPDKHEPRMMSLIPPVHIVLLKQSDIVSSFQQIVDQPPWESTAMPTNIVFISGPSKTADIQQTLAYGAHGPKRLIVIII